MRDFSDKVGIFRVENRVGGKSLLSIWVGDPPTGKGTTGICLEQDTGFFGHGRVFSDGSRGFSFQERGFCGKWEIPSCPEQFNAILSGDDNDIDWMRENGQGMSLMWMRNLIDVSGREGMDERGSGKGGGKETVGRVEEVEMNEKVEWK